MFTAAGSVSTEELYDVETKTIAVDFGKTNIYSTIEEGLAGLEIGVLGKKPVCSLWSIVQEKHNV